MTESEPKTLFGFPVVVTEDAPKGTIIFGPLPTYEDLLRHGSWEAFIEAERKRFGVITNVETD
jgi:hypothetical protein